MKTTTQRDGTLRRAARAAVAIAALVVAFPAMTSAQLDPLISLKRVPPRIVIVFDTSFSMLYDMTRYSPSTDSGDYYCDPAPYSRTGDNKVAAWFNVNAPASSYRRRFLNLRGSAAGGYTASAVELLATDQDASWTNPCPNTRYEIARRGLLLALEGAANPRLHWGLVKLRQQGQAWRVAAGCDKKATVTGAAASDSCTGTTDGVFAVNPPTVTAANASAPAATAIVPSAVNQASVLARQYFDVGLIPLPATAAQATANTLVPAGLDTAGTEDRPLADTLGDARAEVIRAMGADGLAAYRNTVVVLVAGGRDHAKDPSTVASQFLSVSGGGATHRVPIIVVGIAPKPADELQLSGIASASGGLYVRADRDRDVQRAVNLALQAGCQRPNELDAGKASEYPLVSPVVGTVNIENASSASGSSLPHTLITASGGTKLAQRNNFMLVASFALGPASMSLGPDRTTSAGWNPGFEGRLRAYRAYKPVADTTRPSGYTFTKDGTPLWPDLDGRTELAGIARTPPNPGERNIFTYVPGAGMIPFSIANLATLQPALNTENAADAELVIARVRNLPLGGVISSTPAIMDPPSLDPPPDEAYGRSDADGTYAGNHRNRRSIIWVGANDGMLHAIDARTGYEVWAFIPYNLLPKLKALLEGQSPFEFNYFVDQSPKIAEVKVDGGWRSMLIIGQGWGGTFYQAFDVTEAGMGGPAPDSDDYRGVLSSFAQASRVPFKWAFPEYAHFDPTMGGRYYAAEPATVSFGRVKFFGDLKTTASTAERKVGFTWSDPAVGALNAARSVNAAIVGSGYFPKVAEEATSPLEARRSAGVGRTLYLLDMTTGLPVGNGGGGSCAGTGCLDVGDAGGSTAKNALQADPTVTSDYGSYVAKKAYMGDLDGNYWRFLFNASGTITSSVIKATGQPIYASSALMWIGTTQQYIFFSTGSDMLPTSPTSVYGTGTFGLYGLGEASGVVSEAFTPISLGTVSNAMPEGLTMGVPAGERPSTSPSVAGEIVFFTTTVEGGTASTAPGMAAAEPTYNLYAVTYRGTNGYPPVGATTTASGNNKNKGTGGAFVAPVKTGAGRATAPFVVDQHLYFATTSRSSANVEAFGDPNDFNNGIGQVGVRILSWREVRR